MKVDRYRRGQIWWLKEDRNFDGNVQGGTRPVIIISNEANNRFCNNLTVVPCTTANKKSLPTHLKLEINGDSTALCECIRTVSKENIGQYIGTCDSELIEKLDNCIKIALGLLDFYSYPVQDNINTKQLQDILNTKQFAMEVDNLDISKNQNELEPVENNDSIIEVKGKKGRKPVYDKEYKLQFIDDYEHFDSEFMMDKYNIKDTKALQQRAYIFRKSLEDNR